MINLEHNRFEADEIESSEDKLESAVEKQASLLNRLLTRAADIRDDYGERLANIDEKKWQRVKKVPFIRSFAVAGEAALGKEPGGKEISNKEALIKSLVAMLMAVEDVLTISENAGIIKENNKFKGKTQAAMDSLEEKISQQDPSPKRDRKQKIVQAIQNFLNKNKERVQFAEELVHEFLQKKSA